MQRVVRSTLAALTLAGLAACGDKVTVPPAVTTPAVTPVVRGVTVTPPTASMNVGDKLTFSASVNADAGITDRTVTWSSGNTAIATVDANGLVTAVATGTTTIKATSKADASQSASAVVTVGSTGTPGGSGQATIVLSNINQTRCDINGGCTSVPANLGAVTGQLDVTVNVDPGTAKLQEVDLIMNCGGADTVVAKQVLATASIAAASEAAAPVTLSFNTASFNTTTGASAFRNGACTLKAKAVTSGGSVTSTAQAVTLANVDAIVGTVTATKTATDATGLSWNGGAVTITAIPVFYSTGRSAAASGGTITYEGKTASNLTATNGAFSATFTDSNMGGTAASGDPLDIDQITDRASQATIVVSVIDNNGQNVTQVAACGTSVCSSQSVLAGAAAPVIPAGTPFRLDTQKPLPGTFQIKQNPVQLTSTNGYVNGSFKFSADSASGYCGPNSSHYTAANNGTGAPVCDGKYTANLDSATTQGGVDRVTVTFQTRVSGASSSTYTTRTSTSGLAETSATTGSGNSYQLRMITADALGNADTTTVGNFGVDLTPPAATLTGGPVNQAQYTAIGAAPAYTITVIDTGSVAASGGSLDQANGGVPRALVAQVRQWTSLTAGSSNQFTPSEIEGNVYSNTTANTTCALNPCTLNSSQAVVNNEFKLSPCMIGRFNQTQAAAGANALPAYSTSGAIVGYCTPVFYDINAGIPSNLNTAVAGGQASTASTEGGYFTTEIIAIDAAGNTSLNTFKTTGNVDTNVIIEDAAVPVVTGVDLPGSITGNSTVSFPATATDNIDLVSGYAVVAAGGMNLRYAPTPGPGTSFDNVLTTSGSITPTVANWMRSLQASAAAGTTQPTTTTAANNAGTVTVTAVDAAGNLSANAAASLGAVALGTQTTSTWSSNFNQGFFLTDNAGGIVWNCPKTGCGPTGTSTPTNTSITFTAVAGGATGAFNNPFAAVQFWVQLPSTQWILAGTTTAPSVSDDGLVRRWSYSYAWDPSPTAYDNTTSLTPAPGGTIVLPVRAIGINSSGDAVYTSNAYNVTIQN